MKFGKRIGSVVLSAAVAAGMFAPVSIVSHAGTIYAENKTGSEDGYDFELWKDYGTTSMELNGNGSFSCEWSNIGNALFRTGKKFDCTQTYKEIGNISVNYDVDYRPDGNSYLCVYGWTRSPLIEYYIVDSWGSWRPPGDTSIGTIEVDGATYDVYKTIRENQPSIDGDTTFYQYWSVRRDKTSSGTISVSQHFDAWEQMGLQLGKMYECALTVEGYQSNGYANVKKNDIQIGGEITPPIETPPVEPDANGYYFHSTFEGDKDNWSVRGEDKVAVNDAASAAGSSSLYVSGRTEAWNGAGMNLDTKAFKAGETYSFSTMVMQNEAASADFKLSLQYTLNGEENYDSIAKVTGTKGQWVQLAETEYTIPAGATGLLLYVETEEGLTSFYMDEAIGAVKGTEIKASGQTSGSTEDDVIYGDLNHDGVIDVYDLGLAKRALFNMFKGESFGDKKTELAADVNGDGKFTVVDVIAINKYVHGLIKSFDRQTPTPTEPSTAPVTQPSTEPQNPDHASNYMAKVRAAMVETEPSSADTMQGGVDYGTIESKTYFSATANKNKSVNVLLPAGYNANEKYPVLYVLHGIFGNQDSMLDDGMKVQTMAGNLIASGEAEKMIIVFPDMFSSSTMANPGGFDLATTQGYDAFLDDLTKDLMPYIEQNYSVKTGRDNTAITGFSMGGRESLYIGVSRPDLFGYVGAACPAPGVTPATDNFMQHPGCMQESEFKFGSPYPYVIMISAALQDGVVGNNPENYHNILTRNGSDHIWQVVANGGHDGNTVRPHMYNYLRSIFKTS